MPELPEAENICRALKRVMAGRTITRVEVFTPAMREPLTPLLSAGLEGLKVVDVRRRARYVVEELSDGRALLMHFGMTGVVRVESTDIPRRKHEHVFLHLDDGRAFRFECTRRFSVLKVCTDDGSYGRKGLVTEALKELLDEGNVYDEIFAIGPMVMMKFVCKTTAPYNMPTTVSMSPIMIDGTGMCGGCRLTVGGETKFACVDGPDFDGQKVDWDLAVKRNQMYHDFEVRKHEEVCNLFKQEVK